MMLFHSRGVDAEPTLYYVRAMHRDDYSSRLVDRELGRTGVRYSEYREPFERLLRETLAEMFDPAIPSVRGCRAHLPLLRFPRDLQTLTRACRSDFLRVVFSEGQLHFQSAPCPTIAFRGWWPRS